MHSDDIHAYLERTITERHLAGDKPGLLKLQTTCGTLMAAAHDSNDAALAKKFQILAARAANLAEKLGESGR
jgi:hypothetical protein